MLEPDLLLAESIFQQAQVFVKEIKAYLVQVGFE